MLLPAFLLGSSRYLGTSMLVTSASDGIPVFTEGLAYTELTGLSGTVPGNWEMSGPLTALR